MDTEDGGDIPQGLEGDWALACPLRSRDWLLLAWGKRQGLREAWLRGAAGKADVGDRGPVMTLLWHRRDGAFCLL